MNNNSRTLDLDALFTSKKPIIVKFLGQEFPMVRPVDLTPDQLYQFERLSKKMSKLEALDKKEEDFSGEDTKFIEETLNELILLVCPTMPVEKLPFMAKVYVIANYKDEIAKDDGGSNEIKKATEEAMENLTGE